MVLQLLKRIIYTIVTFILPIVLFWRYNWRFHLGHPAGFLQPSAQVPHIGTAGITEYYCLNAKDTRKIYERVSDYANCLKNSPFIVPKGMIEDAEHDSYKVLLVPFFKKKVLIVNDPTFFKHIIEHPGK